MGKQDTTVWAALAISQAVQYGVPYIDPNSLQPTVDAGVVGSVPTAGGFCYVPSPYNVNAAFVGMGALQVGTGGDFTGTDPINAGAQIDSYVPTSIQAAGTVGGISGHSVSTSRGTRVAPTIVQGGDLVGEFSGYSLVNSGTVLAPITSYQKLAAMTSYVQGASATYPGGELRWGTRIDGGITYTDWMKLSNAGELTLSGNFRPPLLGVAGTFQAVTNLYVCTGVPSNAAGANGDFVLRSDGANGSCIYQKRAGAWVATVA